jgi:hypothetical protein
MRLCVCCIRMYVSMEEDLRAREREAFILRGDPLVDSSLSNVFAPAHHYVRSCGGRRFAAIMTSFITGDRYCFAPTRRSRGGAEYPPASADGLGRTAPSNPVNIDRIHSFRYTRSLLFTCRLSLLFLVFAALFLGVSAGPDTVRDAGRRRSAASLAVDLPSTVAQRLGLRADATNSSGDIAIPTAFDDTSLSTNLTSSCSAFLHSVVSNSTFIDCVPLSGLIRVCSLST